MTKGKSSYKSSRLLSLVLWGAACVVVGGTVLLALNQKEPQKTAETEAVEPWYKQHSEPPQMVRLPDAPLIVAPEYAEIDTTIEEIKPTRPLRTKPAEPQQIARLKDVELSAKPQVPVTPAPAIYEEALPDDIYTPPPPAAPLVMEPRAAEPSETLRGVEPRWMRYAHKIDRPKHGFSQIALVIDDLGLDRKRTRQTVSLPGPLTMAFLPYARDLADQTQKARAQGHELMVHMPMEPLNAGIDAGPNNLNTRLAEEDIKARIHWNLERFGGYVGVNNHMGSKATADEHVMEVLLAELNKREMLFLDSRTNPKSVAGKLAGRLGVPFAERNVFLDNINEKQSVLKQLEQLERLAKRTGFAVGIGHPRDGTIQALKEWLPSLESKGITLVPISQIVRNNLGLS